MSSGESIHSSMKPQEAQRYRVTLTALKLVIPNSMLFPPPWARAWPGMRTMSADWHFEHFLEFRIGLCLRRERLVGGREALRLKPSRDSVVTVPIIRTEVDAAIEQPPGPLQFETSRQNTLKRCRELADSPEPTELAAVPGNPDRGYLSGI
jgi:hypothetical protein